MCNNGHTFKTQYNIFVNRGDKCKECSKNNKIPYSKEEEKEDEQQQQEQQDEKEDEKQNKVDSKNLQTKTNQSISIFHYHSF